MKQMSRKKKEIPEKTLIVDNREPLNVVELLAKNSPLPIEFKQLVTGDYVVEDDDTVAIERKTLSDFADSIVDRRLFNQVDRLRKFPHSYVLISGKLDEVRSNVSPHAILGAVAYIASLGITVVKVDSDEELVYLILKLLERHKKLILPNGQFIGE